MAIVAGGQAEKSEMRAGGRPWFVSLPREPVPPLQRKADGGTDSRQTDSKHTQLGGQRPGGSRIAGARPELTAATVVRGYRTGSDAESPRCPPGVRPATRRALGDVASSLPLTRLQASRPLDGRFRRQRGLHRRDTRRRCMTLFPGETHNVPWRGFRSARYIVGQGTRFVPSKPSKRALTI